MTLWSCGLILTCMKYCRAWAVKKRDREVRQGVAVARRGLCVSEQCHHWINIASEFSTSTIIITIIIYHCLALQSQSSIAMLAQVHTVFEYFIVSLLIWEPCNLVEKGIGEIWDGYSGLMYKLELPEGEQVTEYQISLCQHWRLIQNSCENFRCDNSHLHTQDRCWVECFIETSLGMSRVYGCMLGSIRQMQLYLSVFLFYPTSIKLTMREEILVHHDSLTYWGSFYNNWKKHVEEITIG